LHNQDSDQELAIRQTQIVLLDGDEVASATQSDIVLGSQRMALQWIHEYGVAFGTDTVKVTMNRESAGAASIGFLIAFHGRDDKPYTFRI
jgi:carboxylesterase type B